MTLPQEQMRSHIAIHESGHAVAGVVLGLPLLGVEIGQIGLTPDGPAGGGTTFDVAEDGVEGLVRLRPQEMAVTLMAGPESERLFFRQWGDRSHWGDMMILRRGLGWLEIPGESEITALKGYVDEATTLIKTNKEAIRLVAVALSTSGRLRGDEVSDLVGSASRS
jgi:hypothetical protein